MTHWLAGGFEATHGHAVVQDTEGKGRDEGEAEPGGDKALGGPVLVGFDHPAGFKPGLVEGGAGRGAAAADLTSDVDPRLVGGVGELDDAFLGQAVAAGDDDPEWVAEQEVEDQAIVGGNGVGVGFDHGEVEQAGW